jgi:hypothetical protein
MIVNTPWMIVIMIPMHARNAFTDPRRHLRRVLIADR